MKALAVLLTLFVLFAAVGCESQEKTSNPNLTFGKDGCIYDGPQELPTKFDLTWNVEDLGQSFYGYVILTLEEGKTVEDLYSTELTDPVESWMISHAYNQTISPGSTTHTHDIGSHATFKEGPIYFACVFSYPGMVEGVAGPIDVAK